MNKKAYPFSDGQRHRDGRTDGLEIFYNQERAILTFFIDGLTISDNKYCMNIKAKKR